MRGLDSINACKENARHSRKKIGSEVQQGEILAEGMW